MALKLEKGTLTAPAGTGNQTYTLADSAFGTVKALLLWATFETTDADTDGNGIMAIGFGTYRASAAQQFCINYFDLDAAGTSSCAKGQQATSILHALSGVTPTVDYDAALVSLGDHQFVLNWTNAPGALIVVHYLALGGADITDALVNEFTLATAAGTQQFTVATGFGQPDLMLALACRGTTDGDAVGAAVLSIGAGIDDSNEAHTSMAQNTSSATMVMGVDQDSTFFSNLTSATATLYEFELSAKASWPTDGFQVNKLTAPAATALFGVLSLKGTFSKAIGSGLAPTTAPTVTQDLNLGTGLTPRGAFFFHNTIAATSAIDGSHADLGTFGIGATDGTNQGWAGVGNDDANTTAICHRNHSTSKTIKMYQPAAAGTLASEATSSLVTTNVRLTWADTDTVAREYRYVLLGDAPVTTQFGASVVSLSTTLTTTGKVAAKGASVLPLAATITDVGKVAAKGASVMALATTLTTIGRRIRFGANVMAVTASLTTVGKIVMRGSSVTALVFAFTTAGSKLSGKFGQSVVSLSAVLTTSAGKVGARGASVLPLTTALTSTARVSARGASVVPLSAVLTTQGRVGAYSSIVLPLTLDQLIAGFGTTFSASDLALVLSLMADGGKTLLLLDPIAGGIIAGSIVGDFPELGNGRIRDDEEGRMPEVLAGAIAR